MKIWWSLVIVFLTLGMFACEQSLEDKGKASKKSSQSEVKATHSKDNESFDLIKQQEAFKLTSFEVLDVSESEYDKMPALSASFSVPLDSRVDFNQFLKVFDKNQQQVSGGWVLNQSQTRIYFTNIQPIQTYQVVIERSIASITNQRLPKKVVKKITTSQLNEQVRFLNKGRILPRELTNGLAVESVNIKQVDINFHRVNTEQVGRVLSDGLYGYSYYERNIAEYAELVYTARYSLDFFPNKRLTTNLAVHKVKELQSSGLYIAVMKPAGTYPYEHSITSFYVSDLALHVTSFEKSVAVQALKISDGTIEKNVSIEVLSAKGERLSEDKTDDKGRYDLASWEHHSVIIGRKNDDFAVISLATPALDLSEQLTHTRKQNDQELFLYGPRDLYRPGETVHINGLLRGGDGQMIASVPLEVSLIRPDSRVAKQFSWHPEQEGFYTKALHFGKNEATGEWRFQVKYPSGNHFEYLFSIEEFLPETMKLALSTSAEKMIDTRQDLTIKAQGDYLYGAPAAGNRVAANIKVKPIHFPFEKLKDYYFGIHSARDMSKSADLDDQKLDDSGQANWMLPNLWQSVKSPTQIVFEASLFESGGRPVTRRLKQLVWPKGNHIGLRKFYQTNFIQPYQNVEFEIINADAQGELHPLGLLEVSLIRENSRYFWRSNQSGWDYSENKHHKKVYSRTLNESGLRTTLSLPVEYGTYRVEVRDSAGVLKNSYSFFSGWSWDESGEGSVKGARPDIVRVLFDKEAYKAGEMAKVKLISPHKGKALIRVEAHQVLWESQIELDQLESEVDIPVSNEWERHDIYVSALVVAQSEEADQQKTLPKRALGIAPLRLNRSNRKFQLSINAPQITEPEQTVSIEVVASGHKNKAVFVTLAAVDTGVLSLTNYQTPDAHQWFYGQRSYSAEVRDSFSQLIKNREGQLGVLKFGGDAELTRGGEQPNTDVQIVSIFSDVVKLNQNGKAQIPLALPRFNGELRLMALAFSQDTFAHQEESMTVRAPIVAEISKPRFLASNDQSQFGFDLQNMSGAEKVMQAKLSIGGAFKTQTFKLDTTLKDKEKFSQVFNLNAEKIGKGRIHLSLLNEQQIEILNREWFIDVRAAYPAEFKRKRVYLKKDESFQLKPAWIEEFKAVSLQAKAEFSVNPPISISAHLDGLFTYPYGCLEQTSSRAWPLLDTNIHHINATLSEHAKQVLADKNKHIDSAIQRVSGMQRSDGSFGLWSNQSEETQWLTVYALDFLMAAKNSGYSVPESVIKQAVERVRWYVKNTRISYSERLHYSQDPKHYAIAFRAYAAYLLSQLKLINLATLKQLNNQLGAAPKSPLPFAHLAAAFESLGDSKNSKQLWKKALSFKSYSLNYTGDYGTELRDLTWTMLLAQNSQYQLDYQPLIFSIDEALLSKNWFSTQERLMLFRLASNLNNSSAKKWQLKLSSVNDDVVLSDNKKMSYVLSAKDFTDEKKLTLIDGEALYIDMQAIGTPKKQPQGKSEGVTVRKKYFDTNGKKLNFKQVKAGDYVLVKLDISASEKMPDALLVDLLPAGFEIENPALEYSYDFSEVVIEGYPVRQWMSNAIIKHQEYRDDRFVAALSVSRRGWANLFYLMRAVTPGTYQVPPTIVEDMYRPQYRSLGSPVKPVKVIAR
ncbi:alpha-2-macroglobulin family protein [Aliikangiella sp. IMCC44359]|uniref:alpha-2-macroglobulin family protein n=1 Tax=Aliikangiella sp. IMCC44359 TaxID=3459125 RepID=UPI00403AFD3F